MKLPSAVICLTLAFSVAGRPAFYVETGSELIERVRYLSPPVVWADWYGKLLLTCSFQADNLGSTCNLDLSDPNKAWAASKAPQFLDSLMFVRGSGKRGSIASVRTSISHARTANSTLFTRSLLDLKGQLLWHV